MGKNSGTCCQQVIDTKCAKFLRFFVLLVLGSINLAVDWFFYTRVELIRPGLIYGPPDRELKLTIFVFCILSSVGYLIELIHNVDDLSEKPKLRLLDPSLTNFIDIVVTDLPMLTLNLLVTACHDGQPTMISVVKSSVCIVALVVRFLILGSYRCARFGSTNKRSRFKKTIDLLTILGLLLALLISVKIQLLRIFPIRHEGFGFLKPDPLKFKSVEFIKTTYTNNVGIYVQWPMLSKPGLESPANVSSNYIWVADINDVIDETYLQVEIITNYTHADALMSDYITCISKNGTNDCFSMNINSNYFHRISPDLFEGVSFEHMKLTFTKEPANAYRYLFGYIDYNLNRLVTDQNGSTVCSAGRLSAAMYAKFLPYLPSETRNYLKSIGQMFSFYNRRVDLQGVDELWRTGVFGCKMSGDLGPKFNDRIRMNC